MNSTVHCTPSLVKSTDTHPRVWHISALTFRTAGLPKPPSTIVLGEANVQRKSNPTWTNDALTFAFLPLSPVKTNSAETGSIPYLGATFRIVIVTGYSQLPDGIHGCVMPSTIMVSVSTTGAGGSRYCHIIIFCR